MAAIRVFVSAVESVPVAGLFFFFFPPLVVVFGGFAVVSSPPFSPSSGFVLLAGEVDEAGEVWPEGKRRRKDGDVRYTSHIVNHIEG